MTESFPLKKNVENNLVQQKLLVNGVKRQKEREMHQKRTPTLKLNLNSGLNALNTSCAIFTFDENHSKPVMML